MAEEKKAKKVYTLEEIKFNEEKKAMALLACFPVIGLILLFVEKDDKFVRYIGAQYTIVGIAQFVLTLIPVIGWIVNLVLWLFIIIGIVKVLKGERYDVPVVSPWALKLMGSI